MPNYQGVWSLTTQMQNRTGWPTFVPLNPRALFMGGETSSGVYSDVVDYIDISSTGNASDFGDTTATNRNGSGTGNSTRGLLSLGRTTSSGTYSGNIDYITIASTGNAQDFGDLSVARAYGQDSAFSSSVRGIFYGGYNAASAAVNTIDYVTIASAGNATDFGDTSVTRYGMGGASSSTRGVAGGSNGSDTTIDYVTIASTGNATDFGDTLIAVRYLSGTSNGTRGVYGGGQSYSGSIRQNVIQYVTISSTGNATDFGDLTAARGRSAATSGAHGGLQ